MDLRAGHSGPVLPLQGVLQSWPCKHWNNRKKRIQLLEEGTELGQGSGVQRPQLQQTGSNKFLPPSLAILSTSQVPCQHHLTKSKVGLASVVGRSLFALQNRAEKGGLRAAKHLTGNKLQNAGLNKLFASYSFVPTRLKFHLTKHIKSRKLMAVKGISILYAIKKKGFQGLDVQLIGTVLLCMHEALGSISTPPKMVPNIIRHILISRMLKK